MKKDGRRNTLGKKRRDSPIRKKDGEERTEKERERTKEGREGRKTNRQADSRVHARVLLAIRALDETQGPLRSLRSDFPGIGSRGAR